MPETPDPYEAFKKEYLLALVDAGMPKREKAQDAIFAAIGKEAEQLASARLNGLRDFIRGKILQGNTPLNWLFRAENDFARNEKMGAHRLMLSFALSKAGKCKLLYPAVKPRWNAEIRNMVIWEALDDLLRALAEELGDQRFLRLEANDFSDIHMQVERIDGGVCRLWVESELYGRAGFQKGMDVGL